MIIFFGLLSYYVICLLWFTNQTHLMHKRSRTDIVGTWKKKKKKIQVRYNTKDIYTLLYEVTLLLYHFINQIWGFQHWSVHMILRLRTLLHKYMYKLMDFKKAILLEFPHDYTVCPRKVGLTTVMPSHKFGKYMNIVHLNGLNSTIFAKCQNAASFDNM